MVAIVYQSAHRVVARLPGVRDAVHERAEILAGRARGLLAAHKHTGAAKITTTKGRRTDSFVNLEDPQAIAIEYGRPAGVSERGRPYPAMEGLYILHRTVGLR